jgi:hypothetical protein
LELRREVSELLGTPAKLVGIDTAKVLLSDGTFLMVVGLPLIRNNRLAADDLLPVTNWT